MFEFQTWEWTLMILLGLVIWGFLQERQRRKQKRPPLWVTAKNLLDRSNVAAAESVVGRPSQLPLGNYPVSRYDLYDPNDKYIAAAMGMEENRRSFYEQAMESSHNNEFLMGFTSGPSAGYI
jgi:hypothetical protein